MEAEEENQTRVIWKYVLPTDDNIFTLELPRGACVLHVGAQWKPKWDSEIPAMWCVVNPEAEKVPVEFRVIATGQSFTQETDGTELFHVGSFQMVQAGEVWHLFAKLDTEDADLALGALWLKQIAPEKPETKQSAPEKETNENDDLD